MRKKAYQQLRAVPQGQHIHDHCLASRTRLREWPVCRSVTRVQNSMPLEDFIDPSRADEPVYDLNLDEVEPSLLDFLLHEQTGARRVARKLFRIISAEQVIDLSVNVADRPVTAADLVFTDLPPDREHFREPYFRHILRGLRTRVPDYVQDVLVGQPPPQALTGAVEGMVVVRC